MNLVRKHINEEEKPFKYFKGKGKEEILKSLEGLSPEEKFEKACENGILWLVLYCLSQGVNPSYNLNSGIWHAATHGHLDIVKELMKDRRVNPSDDGNLTIRRAIRKGYLDVAKELMKDKRVINKLNKDEIIKFKNLIDNSVNESINYKYFKGKSKEDILKALEGLSPEEIFQKAYYNNIPWLVEYCLTNYSIMGFYIRDAFLHAFQQGNLDVISVLIDHYSNIGKLLTGRNGTTLLKNAFNSHNYKLVKKLLNIEEVRSQLSADQFHIFNKWLIKNS